MIELRLKTPQSNRSPLNSTRVPAHILNGLWTAGHKQVLPVGIYKKIRSKHVHNVYSLVTIKTEGPIMRHHGYGLELTALCNLVYQVNKLSLDPPQV